MSSKSILRNLFDKELGMDVVLRVPNDEREIKAHSVILAGASSFFEKLFLGPWSEKEKKVDSAIVVDMTEISFEVLKMLVNFIYTEEMEFTEKCPVRSAILAADYLMMDDAILKLTEHVIKNIEDETVCEIYEVSVRLFGKAKNELWFYLRNRLDNDNIKVGILSMSLKCFQTLIQDDDRREINIKTVLQTITSWVQHKRSHRARHALSLLKTAAYPMVGLRAMTNQELVDSIMNLCYKPETRSFIIALILRRDGCNSGWVSCYFKD